MDLAIQARGPSPSPIAWRYIVPVIYLIFLMLPLYWLLNMSFKTNQEILSTFSLWPQNFTLNNSKIILTDPSWYRGYINSTI
jgi:glycerol transport system permease protein